MPELRDTITELTSVAIRGAVSILCAIPASERLLSGVGERTGLRTSAKLGLDNAKATGAGFPAAAANECRTCLAYRQLGTTLKHVEYKNIRMVLL